MKLLFISLNFSPDLTGIGKYNGEMVSWLVNKGHDVSFITAPPYYPEWKVASGYSSFLYRIEKYDRQKVIRCPIWIPKNQSGINRVIHLMSFAISSLPVLLWESLKRPQVIFLTEPPLFCAPTAWLSARLSVAKCWLHIQDFEVDAAFDLGIIRFVWMKHVVSSVESWLMHRFDKVSTISDSMLERLQNKGVNEPVLFPNWADTDHIYPLEYSGAYREQLDIPESNIVFLYSGNMGEKQGLEIVIEAARRLADHKNIDFVMCGQGAARSRLRVLAAGLENIYWLPLQPLDKLNDLLNVADVHLLPQRGDATDLVMPSKLTGMLASGRPVLATAFDGTQIAKVLKSSGVIVPPENIDLFVNAIVALAENVEQRLELGKSARDYAVEYLGRDAVLSRFEESLQKCISG